MSTTGHSAERLEAGQLGTADVTASTVANIGPGIDFYFAFGAIAVTAGVGAPLTILSAAVAVVFLGLTVAELSKVEPSAGSFITYVETSLGARAGVATAVLVAVGFTVAIAGVFTMAGGMVALTVAHYTSWQLAWEPLILVLTIAAIWLTARGVRLSTTAVGLAVLVQVAIMLLVCVVVLVDERTHLSGAPFSPSHLSVPRALLMSIAIGTALFGSAAGTARSPARRARHSGERAARHGRRRTWDRRRVVGASRDGRCQRIHEPRGFVCGALDDGHDRDPVRVLADDARAPGVHVAALPTIVLGAAPRRDPAARGSDAHRPVHRAVQAGAGPAATGRRGRAG
jgi:Amino acid permease